jgi:hypothetical protein
LTHGHIEHGEVLRGTTLIIKHYTLSESALCNY